MALKHTSYITLRCDFFLDVCKRVSVYFAIQAKKVAIAEQFEMRDGNITASRVPQMCLCVRSRGSKNSNRAIIKQRRRTAIAHLLWLPAARSSSGNQESHFFGRFRPVFSEITLSRCSLLSHSQLRKAPGCDQLLILNILPRSCGGGLCVFVSFLMPHFGFWRKQVSNYP